MITTLAVEGFRSLRSLVVPLGQLTVIGGANGSGKTSLYQAFHLLGATVSDGVAGAFARLGGLDSVLWAGPETISGGMRAGAVPVQGTRRKKPVAVHLGFAAEDFSYLVDIGRPVPSRSAFSLDPEIKREVIWVGASLRPSGVLVDREGGVVRLTDGTAREVTRTLSGRRSMLAEFADPQTYPELLAVRSFVGGWRFYDSFRVDADAPARRPQVGTWSPVLANDGGNLASAIATVLESDRGDELRGIVDERLAGTRLGVRSDNGWMSLEVHQPGMLRPLSALELSDGTLRFLLLAAALLSPAPPAFMVLNEPETSLHPALYPAVADLLLASSRRTQVVAITHASALRDAVCSVNDIEVVDHTLVKDTGETFVAGQGLLDRPAWNWGHR